MPRRAAAVLALVLTACTAAQDPLDAAKQGLDDAGVAAKAKAKSFAQKVQASVLADLVCSGTLTPGVAAGLEQALGEGGALSTADLLAAPDAMAEVLARASGLLAAQLSSVLAVREVLAQSNLATLFDKGWDGLTCGAPAALPCLAGKGTSTVTCDQGKVTGLGLSLQACRLTTAVYDGAVAVTRVAGQGASADVGLVGFKPSESLQLDGTLRMGVGLGAKAELVLQAVTPLVAAAHQGAEAAQCGAKTTLAVARLSADATQIAAEVDGTRVGGGKTYAFRSTAKHLAWPFAAKCQCPAAGSAFQVTFPSPFGSGAGPTLALAFGPATATACASVSATLSGWPGCSVLDNATTDCGKAASEKLAAAVLGAVCTAAAKPASVSKVSTSGKFKVALTGPTALQSGDVATYTAKVTLASGAEATGIAPAVSFQHPEMGHGGLQDPVLDADGGGQYTVTGVQPSMAGKWVLELTIVKGDAVTFDVTVQ